MRGGKRLGAGRKPKNRTREVKPVEVEEVSPQPIPPPTEPDYAGPVINLFPPRLKPPPAWLMTPEAIAKAREARWTDDKLDWDKPIVPQLPPQWQIAVEVFCRTGSKTEGAKAANFSFEWVSELSKREWWPRAVRECVLRYVDEPREALAELVPKALNRYHVELDPDIDDGDWRAAQDVLDRAWGKPVARVVMEERKDISLTFVDRPPDTVEGEVVS